MTPQNGPSVELAWQATAAALARALLNLADTAGMPDTFWQSDSRVTFAREVLDSYPMHREHDAYRWSAEAVAEGIAMAKGLRNDAR